MTRKGQRSLRMGNAIHCRNSENLTAVFIHERSLSMLNDHKCTYNIANHKCSKHSIEHSWLAPAGCVHGRQTESPFLSIDYAYTLRPDITQEAGTSIMPYSDIQKLGKADWRCQGRWNHLIHCDTNSFAPANEHISSSCQILFKNTAWGAWVMRVCLIP